MIPVSLIAQGLGSKYWGWFPLLEAYLWGARGMQRREHQMLWWRGCCVVGCLLPLETKLRLLVRDRSFEFPGRDGLTSILDS